MSRKHRKIRLGAWILMSLGAAAMPEARALSFTDVAGTQLGGADVLDEFVAIGAGAAWCDLDADGRLDLVLAINGVNRLFRNEGGDVFTNVSEGAGLSVFNDVSHSVTCADYDNDGFADVFFGNNGQNRLFRNSGDGTLLEVTGAAGLGDDGAKNTASASFGDYDGDGHLDLMVVNHAQTWNAAPPHECWGDDLWHNNGDGTFTSVAVDLGVDKVPGEREGCGLATTWSDVDEDGDLDLMVVNDFGRVGYPNVVYRNDGPDGAGGWIFTDASAATRLNYELFGMGICTGDVNNDGHLDYYSTHFGPNKLGINDLRGGYTNLAHLAGVEATDGDVFGDRGLISWGCDFADFNLDGWVDLIVANGWILGHVTEPDQPNYLYRNEQDNTFTEVHEAAGVADVKPHRSIAVADYNGDGHPDFYTGSVGDLPVLYRNDGGSGNNWLRVTVEGTMGNRDGIGARVRMWSGIRSQMREIHGGNSFLSMSAREALFGLDNLSIVDLVEVTFLGGLRNLRADVAVNGTLHLKEPIVVVEGFVDRANATQESIVRFDNVVTNHGDDTRTVDLWVTSIDPDRVVRGVRGPITLTLSPGEVRTVGFDLEVDNSIHKGPWRFLHSVGAHPDPEHQSMTAVKVE